MNRDRAIEILIDLQDGSGSTYEAIRMAIEALKREDAMLKEIERIVLYGERNEK